MIACISNVCVAIGAGVVMVAAFLAAVGLSAYAWGYLEERLRQRRGQS